MGLDFLLFFVKRPILHDDSNKSLTKVEVVETNTLSILAYFWSPFWLVVCMIGLAYLLRHSQQINKLYMEYTMNFWSRLSLAS